MRHLNRNHRCSPSLADLSQVRLGAPSASTAEAFSQTNRTHWCFDNTKMGPQFTSCFVQRTICIEAILGPLLPSDDVHLSYAATARDRKDAGFLCLIRGAGVGIERLFSPLVVGSYPLMQATTAPSVLALLLLQTYYAACILSANVAASK
jgi:hypothetical protein